MGRSSCANLAVGLKFGLVCVACLLLAAAARAASFDDPPAALSEPVQVEPPLRIAFRLRDEVRFTGDLSEWDRDGFDGSFGRREWVELLPEDAQRIFYRLMDRDDVGHWVAFGRMLLISSENNEAAAERAFQRALRLDADAAEMIEAARTEVDAWRRGKREREESRSASGMKTTTPEAGDWKPTPWPDVTPDQRKSARLSVIADGEAALEKVGVEIEPVESDFFIVFGETDRRETARLAVRLDRRYRLLAQQMGLPPDRDIFWGKCLVLVISEQDRFQLIEAGSFNQLVPLEEDGITHYSGPKTFINVRVRNDMIETEATLMRELGHAFLHRLWSPKRLPAWANEGLCEMLAQQVYDESAVHEGLRPLGLRLMREGEAIPAILNAAYSDEDWRAKRDGVAAAGALIAEYLIKTDARAFATWVRDVKGGEEWREAIRAAYGREFDALITACLQFYMVND